MRRIAIACLASLLLYAALFAVVVDRPLTLGFLRAEIELKLARAAAIRGPKLVILAGSNGPYSHRCEVIEPIVNMPCVNGGIAVGIGLDYLFARWKPLLHSGDIVYLPMEEAQYVRSNAAASVGPDAAIMLRHDRDTLWNLPTQRWAGALFANGPRALVMSAIEMVLTSAGFHDPRSEVTGETNAWGDHVGHTAARAATNAAVLAAARPYHPPAEAIRTGDGAAQIASFAAWADARGIRVIGGLPAGFDDSPIPPDAIAAIRRVYTSAGAEFLELPNQSRYPRTAFFDSADHLNEEWQRRHAVMVARGLRNLTLSLAVRAAF